MKDCPICGGSGRVAIERTRLALDAPQPTFIDWLPCDCALKPERCKSFKWGEYNPLECCREAGHEGDHNYVVVGPVYKRASRGDER